MACLLEQALCEAIALLLGFALGFLDLVLLPLGMRWRRLPTVSPETIESLHDPS
jgi:hypothetical protein